MISVVVNSYNEGEKLEKCLATVQGWADEIVVIDMESYDQTREVAAKYHAKIYDHEIVSYIEPVRKFAVAKASGKWIMILDPDEKLTEQLKLELNEIAQNDSADAVAIPRLNIIFGRKIKHTNFWPDYQIRFFKKGSLHFSEIIHSYPKTSGRVVTLEKKENLAILHTPYRNIQEYLQRMERYSAIEAKNLADLKTKPSLVHLITKPVLEFGKRYYYHLGILDGWRGLLLSLFQAYYYLKVEIKLWRKNY